MQSIKNDQFNQPLAETQEEYNTLHINLNLEDPYCPATVCFEFTEEEALEFMKTRRMYYQQCLFRTTAPSEDGEETYEPREQFHPMSLSVINPLDTINQTS